MTKRYKAVILSEQSGGERPLAPKDIIRYCHPDRSKGEWRDLPLQLAIY
ncbi:MAG: hypothetical protein GY906_05010 [bacterium]|nr:hypothetical protein [bacterium]